MVDVAAQLIARDAGEMLAAPSQAAGGSDGAVETMDVSSGHAVPRADDGLTPGTPPTPPRTIRELEHALRGLGYSKAQAREIVSRGFKGLANAEAEEDSSAELVALLARNLELLTKGP